MLTLALVIGSACTAGLKPAGNRDARPGRSGDRPAYPATVAIAWNELLLEIAGAEDHFLTLKGVRAAAMMHLAMHDALNATRPIYSSYAYSVKSSGADPVAAAVQAAFEVAADQYESRRGDLERERDRWLEAVADGEEKAAGVALGRAAAEAILRAREGDDWDAQAEYTFHPMGPGVYAEFRQHSATPQGFVFGAGWAKARPFFLRAADQFRTPPPPEIGSAAYTEAFNEVKEVGREASPARSPDQTHLALWWKDFAESSMNRLARQLLTAGKAGRMDLFDATRLFALMNASIFDGYVSVFENKFHFNHWRPFTAIRWADEDGNPDTWAQPDWNNTHRHTYPFPSYPSAHGTVCAAALTVLARSFGDAHPFTMTTPLVHEGGPMSPLMKMEPPTRSFPSFSSAAQECAISRVYLGIHFRYDSEAGNRLGGQIAEYAWDNFLAPVAAKSVHLR